MNENINHNRLPRNFHQTFKPERQYLNRMLKCAESGQSLNFMAISASTGIPMGSSSGKVTAILDYCRAMGLIKLVESSASNPKTVELTAFGQCVLIEDPYLKNSMTQWIAHFNMCSPVFGADVWYQTFFVGYTSLGNSFPRRRLAEYLGTIYSTSNTKLIGPLVSMYEDEASFQRCNALSESDGIIFRNIAPVEEEYARGYGAWILQLCEDYFPDQKQITISELNTAAGWMIIPGWDTSAAINVLSRIEQKNVIEVDRQMSPWLIRPKMPLSEAWRNAYYDVI